MRYVVRLLGVSLSACMALVALAPVAQAAPPAPENLTVATNETPKVLVLPAPDAITDTVSVPASVPVTPTLTVTRSLPTPAPEMPAHPARYRSFLPAIQAAAPARPSENRSLIQQPFTYTIKAGDTLQLLAIEFGRDLNLMGCAVAPEVYDPNVLYPGQILQVPAADGLCHYADPGESLEHVADRYAVPLSELVKLPYNGLDTLQPVLRAGQRVLVPRPGRLPERKATDLRVAPTPTAAPLSPTATPSAQWDGQRFYGFGDFVLPTQGILSQGYHAGHRAIDIAAPEGTEIIAADSGRVFLAGWSPYGYGNRIVINHGNDYLTLYAHLSKFSVKEGDFVRKGQVIGLMGSTGNSSGPHLHFEIRDAGILSNPLDYFDAP